MSKLSKSEQMSRVKNSGTNTEVKLRKRLWHLGYRYSINKKILGTKPDILLRKYKTAIYIDGCFWHGHTGCSKGKLPKTNRVFWKEKISRNILRDIKNKNRLEANGWNVIRIWECEIANEDRLNCVIRIIDRELKERFRKIQNAHNTA